MMFLTRSRSTALPLFSSGSRCCPAPGSPSGITSSAGGGLRARRPAAGSACTRRTSRRAATAGGSGTRRPRGSPGTPGSSIFSTTTALPGSGSPSACAASVSLGDRRPSLTEPTLAPAIRTSSPWTRKRAVVEDRPDLVVAVVAAGGAAGDEDHRGGDQGDEDGGDAPHGPCGGVVGVADAVEGAGVEERVGARERLGAGRPGSG